MVDIRNYPWLFFHFIDWGRVFQWDQSLSIELILLASLFWDIPVLSLCFKSEITGWPSNHLALMCMLGIRSLFFMLECWVLSSRSHHPSLANLLAQEFGLDTWMKKLQVSSCLRHIFLALVSLPQIHYVSGNYKEACLFLSTPATHYRTKQLKSKGSRTRML